jgi:uncharacterized phage-associated protein
MAVPLYDERKAAEAAAYLLHRADGHLPRTSLMCLLYWAERGSYRTFGEPLTGDTPVALDSGPALLRLHTFFMGAVPNGGTRHLAGWLRISRSRFDVNLKKPWHVGDLRHSRLSAADVSVLDAVWESLGLMSRTRLVEHTKHQCSEWSDPYGTAKPISMLSLLKHLGFSNEAAEHLAIRLADQADLNHAMAA